MLIVGPASGRQEGIRSGFSCMFENLHSENWRKMHKTKFLLFGSLPRGDAFCLYW